MQQVTQIWFAHVARNACLGDGHADPHARRELFQGVGRAANGNGEVSRTRQAVLGLARVTCAARLHHQDWAHPCHICTGTGLTPPHLHQDRAHPPSHLHRDRAHPFCLRTGAPGSHLHESVVADVEDAGCSARGHEVMEEQAIAAAPRLVPDSGHCHSTALRTRTRNEMKALRAVRLSRLCGNRGLRKRRRPDGSACRSS